MNKLFINGLNFHGPIILFNDANEQVLVKELLEDKQGPIIPLYIIKDRNHHMFQAAERNKPNQDIKVNSLLMCVSYEETFKV